MSINQPHFAEAVEKYLSFTGDPVSIFARIEPTQSGFVQAQATIAALNALGSVPGHSPAIQGALENAKQHLDPNNTQDALHVKAATAWARGDIQEAAALWEQALHHQPDDILALRLAHDTHFFLGDLEKLRDVPQMVLPAYTTDSPYYGFVCGMSAFGFEETGAYAQAEDIGRAAVERNEGDSWAIHAVAHVLEMQGRLQDGIGWMRSLAPQWQAANLLAVHQWWHFCLYLIEAGEFDEVLATYDAALHPTPTSFMLDLVDAASLLWRLELAGVHVGTRWQELAGFCISHTQEHVLAFNDLHISLALTGAGDQQGADALEFSLKAYIERETGTNVKVSEMLGLPIIKALRAFRRQDYQQVVTLLRPVYKKLAPVGGSNAQRDLIIQTLGIAALLAGDIELTLDVARVRRRLKTGIPRAWASYAALCSTDGHTHLSPP